MHRQIRRSPPENGCFLFGAADLTLLDRPGKRVLQDGFFRMGAGLTLRGFPGDFASMDWYYAIDDNRQGPVGAEEIGRLSREGVITGETLVWKEGWADWQPFRNAAGEIRAFATGVAEDLETAVCAYSGKSLPRTEMVPYGEVWIAAEHKEAFVQQLMETGRTGLEKSTGEMQFVGFWWRVLASVIDYFVLVVPSMLCMLPYFVASIGVTAAEIGADAENSPVAGWTVAMMLAYGLGMLGQLGVNAFYHTWMLGKYQATLGKIAIGAKVVRPDGSALGYGRAFGRWAGNSMLNGFIVTACVFIAAVLAVVLLQAAFSGAGQNQPGPVFGGMFAMFGIIGVGALLGLFPYWMVAFDEEKRALHDRICSTRVVKK